MVRIALALVTAVAADKWADFKTKFGREYNGDDEEEIRHQIFLKNLDFIDAQNAKGNSYTLGVGPFADMTKEEFKGLLGYKAKSDVPTLGEIKAVSGESLPDSVDWTTAGAVTPVKNQGQCGSCWAFSATGALESGYQIATGGELVQLSEQQHVDCDTEENNGCNGGLMTTAIEWAMNNDLCTEESYAYAGAQGDCQSSGCDVGISAGTVQGAMTVGDTDDDLMTAVVKQPVSVAIEADEDIFQHYTGGVIIGDCGTQLDHGVLLVGYGTDSGDELTGDYGYGDYWKVKNSWSDDWGEQGYFRLVRGKDQCGINDSPAYPQFDSSVTV